MTEEPKKTKSVAEEIQACENAIRSIESQKRNLATRFTGDELARRIKPFDEKLRLRQKKLEELKKGEGDKK
jgi:hypothetical protein